MSSITIRDVAREAELSVSSVSRILRGGQGHVYPEETYQRVKNIADRLGYQANTAARLLKQSTPTMIGMSVHFTEHPYLNRFLVSVHDELLKHDYDPVFLNSQHLMQEGAARLFPPPQMLAGLISMGVDLQKGWPPFYAALRERIPIVAVQPVSKTAANHVDVIHVDFANAYSQACEHLIQLGHKSIAYLGAFENALPSDARKNEGWREAAKTCGIAPGNHISWKVIKSIPARRKPVPESKEDFIYQPESLRGMKEVVEQLKAFPKRITALICGSDEVAIGLQSYLQSQGWKLPRDLSIVGYDGISLGAYVYPALTTIAPNYEQMAQAAVGRLLELVKNDEPAGKSAPQELFIKPQLLVRASTTAPAK